MFKTNNNRFFKNNLISKQQESDLFQDMKT